MDKKVKGKILDIAAELLVSPLTAYAKGHELKESIVENETYQKAKDTVISAGKDIKTTAKKVYESETVQKGVEAVKDTAKKVYESEAYAKAKESAVKAGENIKDNIKDAASKIGDSIKDATAKIGINIGEEKEDNLETIIDGVDISEIITDEDAKEDVPEV